MSKSIAIVGMACEFPGAHSPEELWENVLAGRRAFRKAPPERLPRDLYADPDPNTPLKSYADMLALISGWRFDPLAWRVPPVTFEASDIAHWLALDTASRAVKDSNLDLDVIGRDRVAVLLGNTLGGEFSRAANLSFRWPFVERSLRRALKARGITGQHAETVVGAMAHYYRGPLTDITEDSLAGNMANTIVGRICNHFNIGGGGYVVDGACASSLLAVAHASEALLRGDIDAALAGGVDVSLDPFEVVGFAKARALAFDDIRPYDERAAGMLPGEGCGIFVLMREDEAREQRLRIHAVLKGWGYSSDGSGAITAPNAEGQARALNMAYRRAGYSMSTVGLVEGHGTGTALGDRIEIDAVKRVLGDGPGEGTTYIGSIKGDIGHCKAAAGAAGLVKAVMALKHKIIPPSGNCHKPSLEFGRPLGQLRPAVRGMAWERPLDSVPRRASVSAMGFGGVNAHVTIEESGQGITPDPRSMALLASAQGSEVFPLSAATPPELAKRLEQIGGLAGKLSRGEFTDLSAALCKAPQIGRVRAAFVASSPWELAEALLLAAGRLREGIPPASLSDPDARMWAGEVRNSGKPPVLALMFPGQGAQRLNMGGHFHRRFPFVRELYEQADRVLDDILPGELSGRILVDEYTFTEDERAKAIERLTDTRVAQPALVLSEVASLLTLNYLGLEPDICLGHSLGEISAFCAGGAFDALAAIQLAALRGRAMAEATGESSGGMAALAVGPEEATRLIAPYRDELVVSNYNSPRQTVVSGSMKAIGALVADCKTAGVRATRLRVSAAFHSPMVASAAGRLLREISDLNIGRPGGRVSSTIIGGEVRPGDDVRELLGKQIASPVWFTAAVEAAMQASPALWIEAGPGSILSALVREIAAPSTADCLPLDPGGTDDPFCALNELVARAFVLGMPVRTERLFEYRFHRKMDPETFEPGFIVNPCEREVPELEITEPAPSSLLPGEMNGPELDHYLEDRGQFLREFIRLDVGHFMAESGGSVRPVRSLPVRTLVGAKRASGLLSPLKSRLDTGLKAVPAPTVQTTLTSPAKEPSAAPETSDPGGGLLDEALQFAVEWISKRTGFPASSISPEMKLRDDLNLDSIKAGELAISIGRKFGVSSGSDPAAFANAPIQELVRSLTGGNGTAKGAETHLDTEDDADTGALHEKAAPAPAGVSKDEADIWAFEGTETVAPLENEQPSPLPAGSMVLVLGPAGHDPRAGAVADALKSRGIAPVLMERGDFISHRMSGEMPHALVLVLDPDDEASLDLSPEAFDRRARAMAAGLFEVFKTALADGTPEGFRALVVSTGSTISAASGGALLKTLSQEYASAMFRFITLPGDWEAERMGSLLCDELQRGGKRIAYAYDGAGTRTARVVTNLSVPIGHESNLGPDDVVFVTGGAKGITFELARGLARATGVSLVLAGSSPLGQNGSAGEAARNLEALKAEGIRALYVQCDVTNPDAVIEAFRNAEGEFGPVTGILHGAGVSHLALFRDMEREAFDRCVAVKVKGLYNVVQAVGVQRLKTLHVISSVLGWTGMAGQADYTFANAWLDAAVARFAKQHPHVHCLTMGYSVWAETGLGRRLGAVDGLARKGITPVPTEDGVRTYLELVQRPRENINFVVSGRMSPELEGVMCVEAPEGNGRFLERIIRWLPGGELVSECTLSNENDLYIAEHVFEDTPLLPGVMALEAMTQAACTLLDQKDMPVLEDIRFLRPLIVSGGGDVSVRIHARAHGSWDDATVKVDIRSDADGFAAPHYEATCRFNTSGPATLPECPEHDARLDIDPEEFNPSPLFQGKFFRRITGVYKMEQERECLTSVTVPSDEVYFAGEGEVYSRPMSVPAVRDAFLQSGALILPHGYLPAAIGEVRSHAPLPRGRDVLCHVRMQSDTAEETRADIAVFSMDGQVLETMTGLLLRRPSSLREPKANASPVLMELPDVVTAVSKKVPDAVLAFMAHDDTAKISAYVPADDAKTAQVKVSGARSLSAVANLAAARKAAVDYAWRRLGLNLKPESVMLEAGADGKPVMVFRDQSFTDAFSGVGISLCDGGGISVALVLPGEAGVDLEPVTGRNAEMWLGLLGRDGYELARRVARTSANNFDLAATRVWTLIEAGKKADALKRNVPVMKGAEDQGTMMFSAVSGSGELIYFNSTVRLPDGSRAALSVSFRKVGDGGQGPDRTQAAFESISSDLVRKLEHAQAAFGEDPDSQETETHFQAFDRVVNTALGQLKALESEGTPALIKDCQRKMSEALKPFLTESIAFRRTLEKPFGYPGDHLLMEMMFYRKLTARGLGYHFDRYFLDYPGSEAVRQRSLWVVGRLQEVIAELGLNAAIRLAELGAGPMAIERTFLERMPSGASLEVTALDFDTRALEFARARLSDPRVRFDGRQRNLVSPEGVAEIARAASGVHACVCMGLIEYLDDEAACTIFEAIRDALPEGARFLTSNYRPDHFSRASMEWFLDWWLVYRTEDQMRSLLVRAGFDERSVRVKLDPTGSIVLAEARR